MTIFMFADGPRRQCQVCKGLATHSVYVASVDGESPPREIEADVCDGDCVETWCRAVGANVHALRAFPIAYRGVSAMAAAIAFHGV